MGNGSPAASKTLRLSLFLYILTYIRIKNKNKKLRNNDKVSLSIDVFLCLFQTGNFFRLTFLPYKALTASTKLLKLNPLGQQYSSIANLIMYK